MTSSTVTLRIQELAEVKGLTLEELSQISGISAQAMQEYATQPVDLKKNAAEFRQIAAKLNVPILELVKPVAKRGAFKLKVFEMLDQNNLTLEELSKRSGVDFILLALYSTQPIAKDTIAEAQTQENLTKIIKVLNCSIEELKVAAELPNARFSVEEILQEKGLTIEEASLLTELPEEFIKFISTQPIDIFALMNDFNLVASTEVETSEIKMLLFDELERSRPEAFILKDAICKIFGNALEFCK